MSDPWSDPPSGLLGDASMYRSLDAVVATLTDAERRAARVTAIGQSVAFRSLFAVEVGPPDATEVSIVTAGIHAIEWIGVAAGLALLDAVLDAPPVDRRIVFFPLVNPDGFASVEADQRARRRRFRRGNEHAVDLNRNFPTHFQPQVRPKALAPLVWSFGTQARSEPEVDALLAHVDELVARGARVTHALALHSCGRKVLYPYGGRWRPPVDVARQRAAADGLLARIDAPGYDVVQSSHWVPGAFAPGMELDHFCEAYGAVSLLVECAGTRVRPTAPHRLLDPFRVFNPPDPEPVVRSLLPALSWFVRGAPG